MTNTAAQTNLNPAKTLAKLGLTIDAVFVPFSQSRNKSEKTPSLNWLVTVKRNGKAVLTTDYTAGCARAPSYQQSTNCLKFSEGVMLECETGKPSEYLPEMSAWRTLPGQPTIQPKAEDVFYSLSADADVLQGGGFESWAADLGYDADSRKAEAIFKACLETATKLNAAIGEAGLAALREAFQDY